jgi:hypothetical protein
MGALFSKRQREPADERQRTLSIHPEDWRGKHYSEVVTFLKQKYAGVHVSSQAEKADALTMEFERPLSFQEGDAHIVIVYDAVKETVLGFYEAGVPMPGGAKGLANLLVTPTSKRL